MAKSIVKCILDSYEELFEVIWNVLNSLELIAVLIFYIKYMNKSFGSFSRKASIIIYIQLVAHLSNILVALLFFILEHAYGAHEKDGQY